MAFGRLKNRHDEWRAFCTRHRAVLAEAALPDAIALAEHRFRDLLRVGSANAQGVDVSLVELTAEQWSALARFVAVFCREFESYMSRELFSAFHREAERRRNAGALRSDSERGDGFAGFAGVRIG